MVFDCCVMLYFCYSCCIFLVWKTFFPVYWQETEVGSLRWLNGLLEIWRVMHFVGFLFAFLGFPWRKRKSQAGGIWENGANMMCGLAIHIGGFRTVLGSSFQWPLDGCLSNSFFYSFFFPDSCLAVVALRRVRSVAGGTTTVIGSTGFCVIVTFELCACDGGETSVSNSSVRLAVKTLHDLALRDVAFNWVKLTVPIQAFPDCLVGHIWIVKFHLNT